jgi:hypothetical protein
MFLERWVTDERVWPTFDGWCVEHGIEPMELPSDRGLNLIYYFATRNMDEKQRANFDGSMQQVNAKWIQLSVQKTLTSVPERRVDVIDGEVVRDETPTQRRERRLPPKPDWYGSRDQATRSSLAAKQTLTSRNGKRSR